MKHHRVIAIIWVLCACLWNWFPLFVRLAKSRMPSSGKIVKMLVPSDCQKILGKNSTDPLTPADLWSGVAQGPSNGVITFPSTNQIPWTTKLDCLPEASLPGIIRQHWSWEEQRGILQNHKLCLSAICSANYLSIDTFETLLLTDHLADCYPQNLSSLRS